MLANPLASEIQERRCAIYTRRSLGVRVDEEFNSLEAQRSICSSYISSQRPNGWIEIPKRYDDAGRTGANLHRPAMQDMLIDLEAGLIDVVVVYKLDRITRTILDFVRLMDLFKQYRVHFVSVTQNFDTGDSTGRLILNVLLTFAQFEREISADRLRDKFRTMKERGLFVGGHPPYGFNLIHKKLVPNPDEAKNVRHAFKRYLVLKSYGRVARELAAKGVIRRSRISKRGRFIEGQRICASSVLNMLRNPIYVGEVQYHGERHPGIHEPIVSRKLWNEVADLRARRTRAKVCDRYPTDLLRGLIYDSYGRLMGSFRDMRRESPVRHYRSNQNEWGRRHGVRMFRIRAEELESLVLGALTSLLVDRPRLRTLLLQFGIRDRQLNKMAECGGFIARAIERAMPRPKQCAVRALVERIELTEQSVLIVVRTAEIAGILNWNGIGMYVGQQDTWSRPHPTEIITIPTTNARIKRDLTHVLRQQGGAQKGKPRPYLVALIRRARRAQALLDERCGKTISELAPQFHVTINRFPRLVRLNYLAPDIIASILDGTQPPDLTGIKLLATDLPLDWTLQRRMLGFPDQPDCLKAAPGW